MNNSIFAKLMLRFTGLVFLIIFMMSISVTYFFENYYYHAKEEEFIKIGKKVSDIAAQSLERGQLYYDLTISQLQRSTIFIEEKVWIADAQGMIQAATAGENWLGIQLQMDAVSRVLNGQMVGFRGKVEYFEEPILMVAIPVMVQNQVLGAVFVYSPIEGIRGTTLKLRQLLVYIGVTVLIWAVLMSFQFARSISNPLQKIGNAAITLAGGDYSQRVEVNREDEIGQLASNFNFMGKKLEDHQRLQREFVANVSHELKTPLTSIRGFVKALRDGVYEDEDSPQEYCDIIMSEVDRMNRLVADLLELSQIESEIAKFQMRSFDLEQLAQHTANIFVPILNKGDYRIQVNVEEVGPVYGDPDRIGQVLINLIRNAIKHSEVGSTVWVHAFSVDDMVRVEVKDQGCGIPEEELEQIWIRFHKVDKARTRTFDNEDGTGLGLAIVKQIIERHGGIVDVESKVGQGSTFSFTLKKS